MRVCFVDELPDDRGRRLEARGLVRALDLKMNTRMESRKQVKSILINFYSSVTDIYVYAAESNILAKS